MRPLTKTAWRILLVSFLGLIAVLIVEGDERDARRELEKMKRATLGSSVVLNPETDHKALHGHHRTLNLTAWLRAGDADLVKLEPEAVNQKPWGDVIEVQTITVKGVPVKANRSKISPSVRVSLPEQSDWIGQQVDVLIEGVVEFPYITMTESLAGGLGAGDGTFEVKQEPFQDSVSVLLVGPDDEGAPSPPWYEVVTGLGMLLGLFLLGLSMLRALFTR